MLWYNLSFLNTQRLIALLKLQHFVDVIWLVVECLYYFYVKNKQTIMNYLYLRNILLSNKFYFENQIDAQFNLFSIANLLFKYKHSSIYAKYGWKRSVIILHFFCLLTAIVVTSCIHKEINNEIQKIHNINYGHLRSCRYELSVTSMRV